MLIQLVIGKHAVITIMFTLFPTKMEIDIISISWYQSIVLSQSLLNFRIILDYLRELDLNAIIFEQMKWGKYYDVIVSAT